MFELQHIHWPARIRVAQLTLAAGEMVALLGPNGSGKSSLLKLLAGMVYPPQGRILLNDQPLERLPPAQQAVYRAYLPQDTHVALPLTVEALISLGELPGHPIEPKRKAAILALLELDPLLKRPVHQLSGGEQQRAQLARVFLQVWGHRAPHPRALLLDESLNALDMRFQQKVLHWLKQRCEAGELSVVWASHDLTLALQFSHRGWLVAQNTLQAAAPLDEMAQSGVLSQAFDWPLQLHRCNERAVILPD